MERATLEAAKLVGIDEPSLAEIAQALNQGTTEPRMRLLLDTLALVGPGLRRRKETGLPEEMTLRSFTDLSVWVRHLRAQTGKTGITPEIADWSRRYLEGDLISIGMLQFELSRFSGGARIYRHRVSRALRVFEPGGIEIDASSGDPLESPGSPVDNAWETAFGPEDWFVDCHLPAGEFVTFGSVLRSIEEALEFYAKRHPAIRPLGVGAQGWIWDPQLTAVFRNPAIRRLRRAALKFPCAIPERKTIARLFGPDVERADLASLPREKMSPLQLAILDLLADPSRALRAKGILILREELSAIPRTAPRGIHP